ncbi:hypothetical protein [Streptococcus gordonii]|uniref:hypothetical protein n=1 Tax=Streptococcus gordonii TaxID=1302 RepID=UPI0005F341DF|nr:hypothetical protein [Streptococcus gordonii]KJU98067.1 hypothetical protein UA00_00357 [Streptococcus gordonii]
MKKWLFLTALTALLLGACSTENEVSQENTDKQIGFVQKEDKNSLEKAEKEKLEKEKKEKEQQEKEKKTEAERKLREEEERKKQEEERKAREEQARKEAETKQIAEQAEATVQQLENNQVQDYVAPAQAAVERVADENIKSKLIYRIGLVQNAINIRAQQAAEAEQARRETARLAAEQQQTRTVYVARNGTADVYWYSMENMPSNTRFDRVVSMTEADAIASGKRHTSKE